MIQPGRFRRGDTSSERPGLVFWRYDGLLRNGKPKEDWVTPPVFERFKIAMRRRVTANAMKRKAKWNAESPRLFKRGDKSELQLGKVFWGYWHYGMERWVTPEKFEELRLKKNKAALRFVPSTETKAKQKISSRVRNQSPEKKAINAARGRATRHIYSPRYKAKRRAYKKMRRATDALFKLKETLGTRIRMGFKRQCVRKQTKCIDLIGCTFEFFKQWIANQSEEGMTFENHSFDTWHIEHIIPLCLFDLSDDTAAKHAFDYRNCRPSWGKPNLSKNGRLDLALVAKHNLWEWLPYTSGNSELKHAA